MAFQKQKITTKKSLYDAQYFTWPISHLQGNTLPNYSLSQLTLFLSEWSCNVPVHRQEISHSASPYLTQSRALMCKAVPVGESPGGRITKIKDLEWCKQLIGPLSKGKIKNASAKMRPSLIGTPCKNAATVRHYAPHLLHFKCQREKKIQKLEGEKKLKINE